MFLATQCGDLMPEVGEGYQQQYAEVQWREMLSAALSSRYSLARLCMVVATPCMEPWEYMPQKPLYLNGGQPCVRLPYLLPWVNTYPVPRTMRYLMRFIGEMRVQLPCPSDACSNYHCSLRKRPNPPLTLAETPPAARVIPHLQ